MKRNSNLLVVLAIMLATTVSMAQSGFNYQAVIRNANGDLVANQTIALRITLQNDINTLYQEQQTVSTNDYGVVSVVVGLGTPLTGSFANIDWSSGNISMQAEFAPDNDNNFVTIGTTKLQPVPVAEYAKKTGAVENPKDIQIQATANTGDDEALFSVKDEQGYVVFAVYKNGVRVYVDENDSKAAKSGFAVAGRKAKGGEGNTYFAVNNEGTKVFVDSDSDDGDKAPKSKFAVSSVKSSKDGESVADNYLVINNEGTKVFVDGNDYDGDKAPKSKFAVASVRSGKADKVDDFFLINNEGTKVFVDSDNGDGDKAPKSKFAVASVKSSSKDGESLADNYLVVNDEGTKVYVDGEDSKAAKAKFAVTSVRSAKADEADDFFLINKDGTKVFIDDEAQGKAAKAKFAVTSVKKVGKDGENTGASDYMLIDSDSTRIYIDEDDNGKAAKSGFAVAGKSASKDGSKNLFNIDLTTSAETLDSVNRIYWYPKKNAFMAGNLTVGHADSVGTNSFNAGFQNKAIGEYSQALGYKSRAKGDYSTAIGRKANAEALRSYALGDSAQATGEGSYAIGAGAIATGISSFAFGSYGRDSIDEYENNGIILPAKATGNYAYAIGSGTLASQKGSIAIGVSATASGWYSLALGYKTNASEWASTAMGAYTTASEAGSTAMGCWTYATGPYSTAMGMGARASGENSTAMGDHTISSGKNSIAMGDRTTSSGKNSIAMGDRTTASGKNSIAMGDHTTASGDNSSAMGYYTTAKSYGEVVLGQYNTDYTPISTTGWNENDRLFVIGNGSSNTKKDALIIYKNGDTEISGSIIPKKPLISLGNYQNRWQTVYATEFVGEHLIADGYIGSSLRPSPSDNYDLGESDNRWTNIYSIYSYSDYLNIRGDQNSRVQGILVNKIAPDNSTSTYYGISVGMSGASNTGSCYGVRGETYSAGTSYGIYGLASYGTKRYGVYGEAAAKSNSWAVYANGYAGGTNGWNITSDGRLKKDVQQLSGALDKVLKLRGVSFYWKNREEMAAAKGVPADSLNYNYDSNKHIGVIAQELEKEYPELVNTDGDGFKSVEYSTLTPILIEAIKEQQDIIDAQNKKIEELEAKAKEVDELKAQMEEILEKLK
ncbi:MAG: tail fiber domain-containing protein [Salinivirgaceae bacterium]|nr:tail fiber domain-containing protein [Salinivirgaceae bacterium]